MQCNAMQRKGIKEGRVAARIGLGGWPLDKKKLEKTKYQHMARYIYSRPSYKELYHRAYVIDTAAYKYIQ